MRKQKSKGFSLIELMVVVSIIGILSIIAITALNSARDRSRVSAALSTASGIVPAITLCVENARGLSEGMATLGPRMSKDGTDTGDNICVNTAVEDAEWPDLPVRYNYGYMSAGSSNNPDTWVFQIISLGDDNAVRVACNQEGCRDCFDSPAFTACTVTP